MSQKSQEGISSSWVYHVISKTASTFAREGSLDRAFLNVGPSSAWGVLTLEKDKKDLQ